VSSVLNAWNTEIYLAVDGNCGKAYKCGSNRHVLGVSEVDMMT